LANRIHLSKGKSLSWLEEVSEDKFHRHSWEVLILVPNLDWLIKSLLLDLAMQQYFKLLEILYIQKQTLTHLLLGLVLGSAMTLHFLLHKN
jgi:hypothetical protein